MEFTAILSYSVINGFFLTTILLLSSWVVLPKYRQAINRLAAFSNSLVLVGAIAYLIAALQQFAIRATSSDEYEAYAMVNRVTGPYWWAYWGAILFKGLLPQLLWVKKTRRSLGVSLALAPFLLADYWLPSLYSSTHKAYLPSAWSMMQPSYYSLLIGGIIYLIIFLLLFSTAQLIRDK